MPSLIAPTDLSKHRVLLVNDDGLHARGILLLEELVRQFTDDVWVVAPDEEKSGASHSISLYTPVRVRKLSDRHYAIKGTPTDCVLIAIWELMKDCPPTVIISGINHGENLAEDITYSGTTGIAMEGTLLGYRSIAMSQVYRLGEPSRLDTARKFGPPVLRELLSCPWEPGTFVNVNFPNEAPENVSGIRVTRQGSCLPGTFRPVGGIDGRKAPFYWIGFAYDPGDPPDDTDLGAIRDKAVSITPLQMDLTAFQFTRQLKALFDAAAITPGAQT